MKRGFKMKKIALALLILTLFAAVFLGIPFLQKVKQWRHLDATYQESFVLPETLAPSLKAKNALFHIKTGLDQDDSQICVGFNIIFSAIEAGAKVTILFDAGATLDLTDKRHNLASTAVPLRLQKVIAAQMNLPLRNMPSNYKEYLELLHQRGAKVYANTAMNVVTGASDHVMKGYEAYPFIDPITYAGVAELFAQADVVYSY